MKFSARHIAAFLAAAVATGAIASIVQTQIILDTLVALGAPVTASLRAWTTLEDLARFGPVMAAIAGAALLPSSMLGHLVAHAMPRAWRGAVFALLFAVGLWVLLWLMRAVIPMPAMPGTRGTLGHGLMALTGIIGGLVYARASARPQAPGRGPQWRHGMAAAMLLLVPAMLFFALAPAAGDKPAAVDPASYQVQTVASGLNRPWSVAFLPDGRALVTEMGGRLLAIPANGQADGQADSQAAEIALDGLPPIFRQGAVIGLMEVALDPLFAHNSWLYLSMGYGEAGANGVRLVRAKWAGNKLTDMRVLFSATPKASAGNNGGRIAFLRDGTLVLSVGDGSAWREQAQNPANHLGTLVRLDREGRSPADNPFVQQPGAAAEIYSLGHRNVQGLAFDPVTGGLLATEHGARGGDELNHIVPGGNYGWPIVTAGIDYPFARVSPFRALPGYQEALLEWTPSIAPAGLAVYDGALFPAWRGDLLIPALKERALRRVQRDGKRIVGQQLLLAERQERLRDVKVAPDGAIYVLTDGMEAKLLRLTPATRPD